MAAPPPRPPPRPPRPPQTTRTKLAGPDGVLGTTLNDACYIFYASCPPLVGWKILGFCVQHRATRTIIIVRCQGRHQNRKRDFPVFRFWKWNGLGPYLLFPSSISEIRTFFFRKWKWNLPIFTDLSFSGRQSLVKTSFRFPFLY